jgi:alpha-ketoglutarate-dependent taurine dioxygenase
MADIQKRPLQAGGRLILVLEAGEVLRRERAASAEWLRDSRAQLDAQLSEHGGVLFRGFPVTSAEDFQAFLTDIGLDLSAYVGGNSPRRAVLEKIYTSTEYPAEFSMPIHNELACANVWPRRIAFFCLTPPAEGGETPILDCRRFLSEVSIASRRALETRKVRYLRNLRTRSQLGVGKSWQEAFGTEERALVETELMRTETEFRWNADGSLWTCVARSPWLRHPSTGEETWFNQILLFHPSSLSPKIRQMQSLLAKTSGASSERAPLHCTLEDGTEIPADVLAELHQLTSRMEVAFPWRQGDILLLDNLLVGHGRRPFRGPRRILTGMA